MFIGIAEINIILFMSAALLSENEFFKRSAIFYINILMIKMKLELASKVKQFRKPISMNFVEIPRRL